jgi:hypothetical protein
MGNEEGRSRFHDFLQGFGDGLLAGGVKRASGFVEEENGGFSDKGASDGDPLHLAPAEAGTSLAHDGHVSLAEFLGEIFCMSHAKGFSNLFFGGARCTELEVFVDAAGEEKCLLGNDTDLGPEPLHVEFLDVDSINGYSSGSRLIKPEKKVGDGALPRTTWSDESK